MARPHRPGIVARNMVRSKQTKAPGVRFRLGANTGFQTLKTLVVSLLSVVGEFTAGGVERERRNGDSGAPGEWPSACAAPEQTESAPHPHSGATGSPFLSNNTRQGDYQDAN